MQRVNYMKRSSGRRLFIGIVLLLITAMFLSSCASQKSTSMANDAAYPMEAPAMSAGTAPKSGPGLSVYYSEQYDSAAAPPRDAAQDTYKNKNEETSSELNFNAEYQRKIIMEGNVTIETFDFDKSVSLLDELVESVGGFTESRNVRGKSTNSYDMRHANFVIRVPAEKFEAVLNEMGSIGNVLESNSQGTDITEQYYDSETRIRTLKVQEQTLLDILAKAEKLEDVITLEQRISEVRYEIERLENQLRNYDRLVSFSRISIYLYEVNERTETKPVLKTLNERVSGSFKQSLENLKMGFEDFLVWLAGAWISLIFLALLIWIGFIIFKRQRKKFMPQRPGAAEVKTENKEQGQQKE